jgi:hypothetical protein
MIASISKTSEFLLQWTKFSITVASRLNMYGPKMLLLPRLMEKSLRSTTKRQRSKQPMGKSKLH